MPNARGANALLVLAVFATNFVSLACQVVWVRKLGFVFGATAAVFGMVLSVFLFGLAVGAVIGGRVADRTSRPWRVFAVVEAALGLYCLASVPIIAAGAGLYSAALPASASPTAAALIKLVFIFATLIVPTLCIGAALPIAVRLYRSDSLGGPIARLYGADTIGAALGAFVAGFALVPVLGLQTSTVVAGGTALVVAGLLALRQGVPAPVDDAEPPAPPKNKKKKRPPAPAPVASPTAPAPRLVLITFFATGAAGLLLETGWTRLFYVLNGTSVYSLSTVLTGFLCGIGLGSLLTRRFVDRVDNLYVPVAYLMAITALGGALVLRSSRLFEGVYLFLLARIDSYYAFQLAVCFVIFAIVFVATLAMGANFPLVARICTRVSDQRGVSVGKVFFVNTLGAVAGALLGELVILPLGGFAALVIVTTIIYGGAAFVFIALAGLTANRRALVHCSAIVGGAILWSPAFIDARVPVASVAYYGSSPGAWAQVKKLRKHARVIFRKQGFYGQVAVLEIGAGEQRRRFLRHNGKTDASDAPADNYTQLMLGHLPMLAHPDPRRVLNIGLGAGITLRAVTRYPAARRIVQVELDPLVVHAARTYFAGSSAKALDDARVTVAINDGRSYVTGGDDRFDVIISEPPNVWVAGVSGLFTREFYAAVKGRLAPGGILCQWAPLYELHRRGLAVLLATMKTEFAHVAFWGNDSDAVILASQRRIQPDAARTAARTAAPGIAADMAFMGKTVDWLRGHVSKPTLSAAALARLKARADVINVDDRPVLEFISARNIFVLPKQQKVVAR